MKNIFLISAIIVSSFGSNSQSINLPTYQYGQYESDSIYVYYGSLTNTGIGSITLGGQLSSGFVSGVDFKMIVDSTNQGASPTHATFKDSSGTLIPIYKGDTLSIPLNFQLFAGELGFHIIIEGAPLVSGETYLCDLGYKFATGNDWEMILEENTTNTCTVGSSQGINGGSKNSDIIIYPNPAKDIISINIKNASTTNVQLINSNGQVLKSWNNIRHQLTFSTLNYPKGLYYLLASSKTGKSTRKLSLIK